MVAVVDPALTLYVALLKYTPLPFTCSVPVALLAAKPPCSA
jgi:hypothetical protein